MKPQTETRLEPELRVTRRRKRRVRSIIKRTILKFVNRSNSYILQRLPDWVEPYEPRLAQLRNYWVAWGRKGAESDQVRLLFLLSMIERLSEQNIPGAFAEVGVYQGHTAKLFSELAPDRDLYLFDTFEGFAKQDVEKEHTSTGDAGQSFKNTSLDLVKEFLGNKKNIFYCPGYFPESAKLIPGSPAFALLHLDPDLYQPTLEGLKYFYPRMSPGGIIIIHDYQNVKSWPGVKRAVDEFLTNKSEGLILIPDSSGTAALVKSKAE